MEEAQSGSPCRSGPVDEVMSVVRTQGGEFEKEVEPLPSLLCGWGYEVRLRPPESCASLYSVWLGRPAPHRADQVVYLYQRG